MANRIYGLELPSDNADIICFESTMSIDPIDVYHYDLSKEYPEDILRAMPIAKSDNHDVAGNYIINYVSYHERFDVFVELLRKDTTCTYIARHGGH